MRCIRIPNTDLEVSTLCLGAGGFGTGIRGADADRLVGAFLDAGGSFFDTAHCYAFWLPDGLGASERELAASLRRLGAIDRVTIGTKGGHPSGGEGYRRPDRYLAPEVIAGDIQDSLSRMGLECLSLYTLHRDDRRVPVGEIVDALHEQVSLGRIRYLGASNWTVARIAEANDYASRHGRRGFALSQIQWSLAVPTWEPQDDLAMRALTDEAAAWHQASGLPVCAYSSTSCGYLAAPAGGGAEAFRTPANEARRARAVQLAAELGCTPTQVGLAWLLAQRFPVVPIFSTSRVEHLREAVGATGVALSPAQVRWLRSG